MARSLFLCLALFGTLALATPRAGLAVSRFDTAEILLRSASSYNANSGTPNPFTAVDVTARVTSPSGRVFTVNGFFDGDGAGGAVGNVFKIRVYAGEAGTWRWTTASNTAGLHGVSGTFSCSGTLAGVFAQGPVVENPARPRTLKYQYGEPVYLLGKFLDVAAPSPLQYSHTMFSEKLTDTNRQAMLDRHRGMKLNKMAVYLANRGDYSSVSTTPWVGTAASPDRQRFDLARWRMFERWVVNLRNAGMLADLWFFADDSGFGDLPDADRKLLVEYAMARLSGYVNTTFVLALEWQEGWTTTEVGTHMSYLHTQNPWARMATVHGVPGDFSFPTAAWADYMDTQAGNEVGHAAVHSHGLRNRGFAVKPLIQEEFGLGSEDTAHRQKAWAAFTAGAAGSGTGAFLKPLATFVEQIDFEKMDPANALALSGNAYVLAEKGAAYVFYLYNGGTLRADLRNVSGTFEARWYDPRTGVFSSAGSATGGVEKSFTAPAGGDWVLHLRKTSGTGAAVLSPPPPPSNLKLPVSRAHLAAYLVVEMRGTSYALPAATGLFSDVLPTSWAAPWAEQAYREGWTKGCASSPLRFCPTSSLTRAEMAIFLLRARHGGSYHPPAATGKIFTDVPASHWAAAWIEQLYREGITTGCSAVPRSYCPGLSVSWWEMQTFLGRI
ncbi:MAG TPA: DUF5060 domain-containing protein [Thermoanaerobaculia bacterium]|nr:DUF5060 domain-containing protein [Thermoanaerobaculia bacterium]